MISNHINLWPFEPIKSQTIFSCKRKATLLLQFLSKIDSKPTASTITTSTALMLSDIYSIFSPYQLRNYWIGKFGIYSNEKKLALDTPITRGLLLDYLAYSDGYPGWTNLQHYLKVSSEKLKTYSFRYDSSKCNELLGGYSVNVFYDDIGTEDYGAELFNPAREYGQSPVGYSWGYRGTSVYELARALLYSIDPKYVEYAHLLTEKFLSEFVHDNKVEMLVTELEIKQFIEHGNR